MSSESNKNNKHENIPVQPYSLKELSAMYGVSKNTFKKWLQPFKEELGKRNGYYYNNKQVKLIFDKLGSPEQKFVKKPKGKK